MDERQKRVLKEIKRLYPGAECALEHESPFQLLMATILSAQCTDKRVNMVTPDLFKRYPTAEKMARAKVESLETLVKSTGFYRNKAKNMLQASRDIVKKHGGEVPKTMEELHALAGVGRKTANVVLGNAFGINEGVVVDTHVGRLSRRLGFTKEKDPVKVEKDLIQLIPRKDWTDFSHWLILHGRALCKAQRPRCGECTLAPLCPSSEV